MLFIKPGPGEAGGRCHTPSGQVSVTCTAGGHKARPYEIFLSCTPLLWPGVVGAGFIPARMDVWILQVNGIDLQFQI